MSLCQRVIMESLNNYVFFATLTYNNEMIPRLVTSQDVELRYADWRDLQLCFKRLRASNAFTRPFRYVAVSELGSKKGRPHFHILFFLPKLPGDDSKLTPLNLRQILYDSLKSEWRRNVGSRRVPIYKPLFTFQQIIRAGKVISNYDLHYVTSGVSDDGVSSVSFYVMKYMLKRSDRETRLQQALKLNYSEEEYNDIWDVVKTRIDSSLYFGLNPRFDDHGNLIEYDPDIISYLKNCVSRSSDFAKFFNPSDGKSFPLAKYYKKFGEIYSVDDALRFVDPSTYDGGFVQPDFKSHSQLIKSVRDYEKIISNVSERGDADNYFDIFE